MPDQLIELPFVLSSWLVQGKEVDMIDDGFGEIIARVFYAIFRNRPNLAYTIFALVVLAFIGAMYINAQTPDEHVMPVILFVFVVSVVLGHTIRDLRRVSIQDSRTFDQMSPEDATPEDRKAETQRSPRKHGEARREP